MFRAELKFITKRSTVNRVNFAAILTTIQLPFREGVQCKVNFFISNSYNFFNEMDNVDFHLNTVPTPVVV